MSHVDSDPPGVAVAKQKLAAGRITEEEYAQIVAVEYKLLEDELPSDQSDRASGAYGFASTQSNSRMSGRYGFAAPQAAEVIPDGNSRLLLSHLNALREEHEEAQTPQKEQAPKKK